MKHGMEVATALFRAAGAREWLEFNLEKTCSRPDATPTARANAVLTNAQVSRNGSNVQFVWAKLVWAAGVLLQEERGAHQQTPQQTRPLAHNFLYQTICINFVRAFRDCETLDAGTDFRMRQMLVRNAFRKASILDENVDQGDRFEGSIQWKLRYDYLVEHGNSLVVNIKQQQDQVSDLERYHPTYLPSSTYHRSDSRPSFSRQRADRPGVPSTPSRYTPVSTPRKAPYSTPRAERTPTRQTHRSPHPTPRTTPNKQAPPTDEQVRAWWGGRGRRCLACGEEGASHKWQTCPERARCFPWWSPPELRKADTRSEGHLAAAQQQPTPAGGALGSKYDHRGGREDRGRSSSRSDRRGHDDQEQRGRSSDRKRERSQDSRSHSQERSRYQRDRSGHHERDRSRSRGRDDQQRLPGPPARSTQPGNE
jgi:hypothetical protein